MTFDLVLVGFGHVSRRVVRLLTERADRLRRDEALETRIVGIATARHGCVRAAADNGALDGCAAAACVEAGASLETLPGTRAVADPLTLIRDVAERSLARQEGRLVLVEATVLTIVDGRPAIDHVEAGLSAGAHVITVNKGPAAFAAERLQQAAAAAGRRLLFEGAVMDGIPVFNLVRDTLPVVSVEGVRGVINTTTNYMLTAVAEGRTFDEALAEMQAAGVAEADASLDVEGWDAAAKTAALANVLMQARTTPAQVDRTGIRGVAADAVRAAARRGGAVKLVASAERDGHGVRARVRPEELPAGDFLAGLRGSDNALVIRTDLLGEIAIVQRDSGLTQTAYAVIADLVTLRRSARGEGTRSSSLVPDSCERP